MRRTSKIQHSKFVQAESSTEGCNWTVFVDLAAMVPVATACPMVEMPHDVTELRSARRSCESVARRVAAQMNAARDAH